MARRRVSLTVAAGLLLVFLAGGLAGCSRPASTRDLGATDLAASTPTPAPLGVEVQSPASAETVVSAMPEGAKVSAPAAEEQASPTPSPTPTAALDVVVTPVSSAAEALPTPLPTPTQPPPPAPGDEVVTHTVQRDETLSTIAALYGTTVEAIVEANNLSDPSQIHAGQVLIIPVPAASAGTGSSSGQTGESAGGKKPACQHVHTVKRGEWVFKIAARYGVSPAAIIKANNLTGKEANMIYAGQELCIP